MSNYTLNICFNQIKSRFNSFFPLYGKRQNVSQYNSQYYLTFLSKEILLSDWTQWLGFAHESSLLIGLFPSFAPASDKVCDRLTKWYLHVCSSASLVFCICMSNNCLFSTDKIRIIVWENISPCFIHRRHCWMD